MSIEEAIREFTSLSSYYKDRGSVKDAVDHQQIANWLQELKERRENASRQNTQNITELTFEAFIDMTKRIIEIIPDLVASVKANIPEAFEKEPEANDRQCEKCRHKVETKPGVEACDVWDCSFEPKDEQS